MTTSAQPSPAARIYQVLVVDDDVALRELLGELLQSPWRSVELCADGFAAIEFAKHNPVDLAFVDLNLPGLHGSDVAGRIKELYPHAHVLVCTGYSAADVRERVEAACVDGVLEKPVDFNHLLALTDTYAGK